MSLGTLIEERGLKRSWIASKIGVSRSAITRWVTGDWPIPPARAAQLAELLKVAETDLCPPKPATD